MATLVTPNISKLVNNTAGAVQSLPDESFGGKGRRQVERYAMAGAAIGDQIHCARLPFGSIPLSIVLTVSVSAGTGTTISVGDKNNTSRFAAAGTLTSTDTPTEFHKNAATRGLALTTCYDYAGVSNTNYEDILLTIGTSSLSATGTLVIETHYLEYNS